MCKAAHEEDMEKLRSKTKEYDSKNLYNVDETGLLYSVIPSRSYLAGKENCANVRGASLRRNKQHVTIIVCANVEGSRKHAFFFIVKSKIPRCFLDFPECFEQ